MVQRLWWAGLVCLVLFVIPLTAQNAIDFTLRDINGQSVRLNDHLGDHVVLLNFWATWCTPCVKEFPHFQRLHESYQDQGLQIFAISADGPETAARVKPFLQRYQYTFPVLLDVESKVTALYNPQVILPYSVLIDRQGRIRYVHQGYSPGDELILEDKIQELLRQQKEEEAAKYSVSGTEAFLYRNFRDDELVANTRDNRKNQIINQLDMNLSTGDLLLGGRFDLNLDWSPMKDKYTLAKRYAAWRPGSVSLWGGDFYHQSGRGLVFSLLKIFEKEGLEHIVDTTVDGGKASVSYGPFHGEAFGGWIDRFDSDLKDTVYGATLGWQPKKLAEVKLNIVHSSLKRDSALGNKDVKLGSFSLDIPDIADRVKFFGEFALIQKNRFFNDEELNGHGLYLESSFALGNVTLLFEFKDYLNLDYEFNRPPLLESEELPIIANQYVKDARDITGITGRIDYYLPRHTTLFWSRLTYFNDNPETYPRKIFHIYGGIEKKFHKTGWFKVLAGFRNEDTASIAYFYTSGKTYHYQANLSVPFTPRLSLEVDVEGKEFKGTWLDYYERRSFVSLHYSPRWILTMFFDQTSDPLILFVKDKRDWLGLELEVKFSQAHSLKVFYGANKGGVKCSGGICKFLPPFEGLRIEGLLRF